MKRGPKRAPIKGLLARFLEANPTMPRPSARAASVTQATKRAPVRSLSDSSEAQVATAG